jgi:oligopeptide transport system substrate-binding protein
MKRVAPIACITLVFLLIGCGKGNFSQRESQGKANVFRYPIFHSPTTLDPADVQDGDTIDCLQNVYEGLVGWGADNKVEPRMASSWDIKNGGKTYIFHLVKGVKFTNGRECTADDFKWTLDRNCAKEFGSPVVSDYLDDIAGFHDYNDGKRNDLPGVKVIDPYTLEIDITAPRPYFIMKLTYLDAAVLCKEAIKPGEHIKATDEMVATGPFTCIQFVPDQIVVLQANKTYHGGVPLIDKIERPVIPDAATRLNKYKNGEIDLVQLERQDVTALQQDATYKDQLHLFDRASIFYVGLNQKAQPAFAGESGRHLRRAIAMSIDRNTIVSQILGGLVNVADGILPPSVLGHRNKTAMLPFDVNGAKKELALAGYADPAKVPELVIQYRSDRQDYKIVAEAVQSQVQTNLGIKITPLMVDWTAYLKIWDEGKIGFFHMRWAADYLDPQDFLSTMMATYGNEDRGLNYNNPQFDALCKAADAEPVETKRLALYAQAEDLALQDAPWVPIYFQRDAELISPRVSGIRDSVFGHLPHTTVKLAP